MATFFTGRRAFGVTLLILGSVFVGLSTRAGSSIGRTTLWLTNAPFEVSPGTARVTLTTTQDGERVTRELPLELEADKSTTAARGFVRIPVTGTVIVHRLKGSTLRLGLVPPWTAYLAGLGVLCWFIGLPYTFLPYTFLRTEDLHGQSGKPVGPWYSCSSSQPGVSAFLGCNSSSGSFRRSRSTRASACRSTGSRRWTRPSRFCWG